MRSGQSATEFVILLGFVLLAFLAVSAIVRQRQESAASERRQAELAGIAQQLEEEVRNAAMVSDGYERTFTLESFEGQPASLVLFRNNEATLRGDGVEHLVMLPANITVNESGALLDSATLTAARFSIRKDSGRILLEAVS